MGDGVQDPPCLSVSQETSGALPVEMFRHAAARRGSGKSVKGLQSIPVKGRDGQINAFASKRNPADNAYCLWSTSALTCPTELPPPVPEWWRQASVSEVITDAGLQAFGAGRLGSSGEAVRVEIALKGFKRPRKDPDAPKRPLSAYNLYFRDERSRLQEKGLDPLTFEALGKHVGEEWRKLPASEKRRYEGMEEEDRTRYHAQVAAYLDRDVATQPVGQRLPSKGSGVHAQPPEAAEQKAQEAASSRATAAEPSEGPTAGGRVAAAGQVGLMTASPCPSAVQSKRVVGKKGKPTASVSSSASLKRPLSAYNLYFREERVRMKAVLDPSSDELKDMSKVVAQRWSSLPDEEKQEWQDRAQADRDRYERDLEALALAQAALLDGHSSSSCHLMASLLGTSSWRPRSCSLATSPIIASVLGPSPTDGGESDYHACAHPAPPPPPQPPAPAQAIAPLRLLDDTLQQQKASSSTQRAQPAPEGEGDVLQGQLVRQLALLQRRSQQQQQQHDDQQRQHERTREEQAAQQLALLRLPRAPWPQQPLPWRRPAPPQGYHSYQPLDRNYPQPGPFPPPEQQGAAYQGRHHWYRGN